MYFTRTIEPEQKGLLIMENMAVRGGHVRIGEQLTIAQVHSTFLLIT
jgi:hypothetical protein